MIGRAIPILHVADTARAEDFYCRLLGFRVEFLAPASESRRDPAYLSVTRDGATIHLSAHAGDGVPGAAVYLPVRSVDALHEELRGRGVPIDLRPIDQSWGMREMYVRDPDGNSIRFGTPIA